MPRILASAGNNTPANYTLDLGSLKNITLNDNGALILMNTPTVGFLQLKDCSNITVANLTVDDDPLPFTQGTIQSVSGRTFEVILQDGFPA